MESARLRLEKRGGVTPEDGEDEKGGGWEGGGGRGREKRSDGKWIKFRRMFLFGRDAESIWLAFETALSRHRLFISVTRDPRALG